MNKAILLLSLTLLLLALAPSITAQNYTLNITKTMANTSQSAFTSTYGDISDGSIFRENMTLGNVFFDNIDPNKNYTSYLSLGASLNDTETVIYWVFGIKYATTNLSCTLSSWELNYSTTLISTTALTVGETLIVNYSVYNGDSADFSGTIPMIYSLSNDTEGWLCGYMELNVSMDVKGGGTNSSSFFIDTSDCTNPGQYRLTVGIDDYFSELGNMTCPGSTPYVEYLDYHVWDYIDISALPVSSADASRFADSFLILAVVVLLILGFTLGKTKYEGASRLVLILGAVGFGLWFLSLVIG